MFCNMGDLFISYKVKFVLYIFLLGVQIIEMITIISV